MVREERRKSPRHTIAADVTITVLDDDSDPPKKPFRGRILDVSAGGCFLLVADVPKPGSRLRITGDAMPPVEAVVVHTVARPVPVRRFRCGAGLRFTSPRHQVDAVISSWTAASGDDGSPSGDEP